MVRRYEEPIEVRARAAERSRSSATSVPVAGDIGGDDRTIPSGDSGEQVPTAFLWRGRLYVVREVIGHWRERRAWWREAFDPDEDTAENTAAQGLDCLEQQVWRVEASPGRLAGTGVYDLGMDGPVRGWRLLRVAD